MIVLNDRLSSEKLDILYIYYKVPIVIGTLLY